MMTAQNVPAQVAKSIIFFYADSKISLRWLETFDRLIRHKFVHQAFEAPIRIH